MELELIKVSAMPKKSLFLILTGVCLTALLLRAVGLASYPVGMHHDEAWFGYNSYLLASNGTNIYGESWPISLDMFGDNVSAMQSYLTIPAVLLFGLNLWSIRITVVFFSLLGLILGLLLFHRLTRNKWMTIGFGLLFALSPWNIIMTRASSTVIIDTAVLLGFLLTYMLALESIFKRDSKKYYWKTSLWLLLSYLLAVIAYFTYFTSRLLIFPMGLGLATLFVFNNFRSLQADKKLPMMQTFSKLWQRLLLVFLPLAAFLIFPFLVMLSTPFALGRFEQTTVINSDLVKNETFQYISRSGQAGLPVEPTRLLYNKMTTNLMNFSKLYLGLISPSVLLFESGPPARYELSGVGVVTWLEMMGVLAAVGLVLLGNQAKVKSDPKRLLLNQRQLALLFIFWTAVAAIPSALTLDDFPNLQRAVIMTPFLQMAAALGLWLLFIQLGRFSHKITQHQGTLFILTIGILSIPSIMGLVLGYKIHSPYDQPQFRHGAGSDISQWIAQNDGDNKLLIDNKEGVFFLRYFFAKQNLLNEPIIKEGKYYDNVFQIGNDTYVSDLCESEEILTRDYDLLVLYTFSGCKPPPWMTPVYSAKYANGSEGFAVLEPDEEVREILRKELLAAPVDSSQSAAVLRQAWTHK